MSLPSPPLNDGPLMSRVVEAVRHVNSPLGFFALLLLFLYLFLVAAGLWFGLPEGVRIWLVFIGVFGFVFTGTAVLWLAARHPTSLVFGERTQLRYQEMLFGNSAHPISAHIVETLVAVPAATAAVAAQPEQLTTGHEPADEEAT